MGSRKRLGAIAIFGVSMVSVCSLELSQCFAQYHFLGRVDFELPQQFFYIIKGGVQADSGIDVQGFHITPVKRSISKNEVEKVKNFYILKNSRKRSW
ncbi:hypothetical protein HED39_02715 [Enterococcus casseliflavus]|uniref:hypothetical protein n=1 Tax=Enterococcus casseliflavus TaxID=37734 RepID=UPI001432B5CE|nr:hypothetical protein [Enterococcus casseliflavus]NKD28219.1 hypothetical protein [Enterococcus casseliflavus]